MPSFSEGGEGAIKKKISANVQTKYQSSQGPYSNLWQTEVVCWLVATTPNEGSRERGKRFCHKLSQIISLTGVGWGSDNQPT